jgi:hypothetical protein
VSGSSGLVSRAVLGRIHRSGGQEDVGSSVLCCSRNLSVSKNNPSRSPEHQ